MSGLKMFAYVFIKPFFRENAGAFIFFYTVMILAVGHLDGQGVIFYHHSLIMSFLKNADILILVCTAWLLYILKCFSFIRRVLKQPSSQFLYVVNMQPGHVRFLWAFVVMLILFLPLGWYGCLIVAVAWLSHYYANVSLLFAYLLLLCIIPAVLMLRYLKFPGTHVYPSAWMTTLWNYPGILMRFIFTEQKVLFVTIKIVSCGILYGFARINTADAYDVQFPFLFFSLALLAHSVLIHRLRSFEEVYLVLYRTASVNLFHRFLNYIAFFALLMIPEFITIWSMVPVHLHYADALNFTMISFGLMLLLHSICLLEDFNMKSYLRIVLVILCIQYFFVVSGSLLTLSVLYPTAAVVIFFNAYYTFEKRPKSGNN